MKGYRTKIAKASAEPNRMRADNENSDKQVSKAEQFLGGSPWRVVLKLGIISLILGIVLYTLGFQDASQIFERVTRMFRNLIEAISSLGRDTFVTVGQWLVLGAVIVLPIWLVARLIKYFGKRR